MNNLEVDKSILRRTEVTTAAVGAFVVGVIYRQPELSVAGLAVGGVEILSLLSEGLDYIDWRAERAEVVTLAEQITAEAAE